MDQIPTRKGPLLTLLAVIGGGIVLLAIAVRAFSGATAPAASLARLELTDEHRETVLAAVPGGHLSFWTVRVTEEGALRERMVDTLRYEIELRAGEQVLARLSCDPYRAGVYLRESHDDDRHELEHDMDDCSSGVPASRPITVRARRVWLRQPEGVRFLQTELVIRP